MIESPLRTLPVPYLGVTRSALGRTWVERCDASGRRHRARDRADARPAGRARPRPRRTRRRRAGGARLPQPAPARPPARSPRADRHGARRERLADAVERRETVAIFGDYDVDGACSAALLAEYLRACGVDALIHIPDRITEGYGPNVEAIRSLPGPGRRTCW